MPQLDGDMHMHRNVGEVRTCISEICVWCGQTDGLTEMHIAIFGARTGSGRSNQDELMSRDFSTSQRGCMAIR